MQKRDLKFSRAIARTLTIGLMLCSGFAFAQNVSGQDHVCAGQAYYYYADPAGGSLKNWGVSGGTIVSGTIHDVEIQVAWDPVSYADISWMANPGGDGGSKQIFVTNPVSTGSLEVDCHLGTDMVDAETGSPDGATQWYWTITGFGFSTPYSTTTSSSSLSTQVPDSNVPGTVCVKAYYPVCGNYGPQSCESYP